MTESQRHAIFVETTLDLTTVVIVKFARLIQALETNVLTALRLTLKQWLAQPVRVERLSLMEIAFGPEKETVTSTI
jgi:hypothetical protein